MLNDFRYAVRTLTTARGFTLVAVSVLALGIGLNTALYSIVYSVFFRPLPVHEPDRLVYVYWMFGRSQQIGPIAFRHVDFFRDHDEPFADVTAHVAGAARFTADGETEQIRGEKVLANYFDLLGVKPTLGRAFTTADDSPGDGDGAIVIAHSLWMRRFGGDPGVLGTKIRLNDWSSERHFTIVGVMGEGFKGVTGPWTPSQYWVTFGQSIDDPRRFSANAIGRVKPGITLGQAQAIVETRGAQLLRPGSPYRERYLALPANSVRIPSDPTASVVPARLAATMLVVVGLVLLIAGANIAGMLSARGVGRAGEIAIRSVLGASTRRLVRQLLTESVLLSTAGGLLGLIVARWILGVFRRYTPPDYAVDVAMDPRVLLLTAGLCVVVGVLIGVAPALRATRTDLLAFLPGTASSITTRGTGRLRHWVVIPQVGLSLVLLLAAGFHIRSLMAIELANLGYDPRNVVVLNAGLRLPPGERVGGPRSPDVAEKRAARSRAFYRQIVAGIAAIPGTGGTAVTSRLPLNPPEMSGWNVIAHEAFLAGDAEGLPTARTHVSPGFFRTLGIGFVEGRDFDDRDSRTSPRVAIVSQELARRLWPGRSAIGRSIAPKNNFPGPGDKTEWHEVVGVVGDLDPIIREQAERRHVYLNLGQDWQPQFSSVLARVPGDRPSTVHDVRQAVLGADALAEVYRIQTVEQAIAAILYPRRLAAAILGASGAIGMLLAAIGLYGVIAYAVAQRVQEIGVRMALGADRRDVERLVIREGIAMLAAGTACGLALTYAALRVTARYVTLPQLDAGVWLTVPLALAAVILLACYIPARRASRLDPMAALRQL
jgi:putative ABC transport system permease protein